MVQVGRGRHSGFLISGITKPLRAYVEPSGCFLMSCFCFVGSLVQVGRGRHSGFEWGY